MQTKFLRLTLIVITFGLVLGMGVDWLSSQGAGFSLATSAIAQDEDAAEEVVGEIEGAPTTFLDYWRQGGPTMWPLLGLAIWATAVLIELSIKLRMKVFCPPDVRRQLNDAITVGDYHKAWRIGMENPSPLSSIFCRAVEKLPKGRDAVDETTAEATTIENNIYTSKNSYISLCAAISPLLGLLGTMLGMIGAFNAMAYGGAVGDPTKLAGDIGEALLTTLSGLIIAIPCMGIYFILANRLKKMIGMVQGAITEMMDTIDFDTLPEDLVVVTKEMKAKALSGALGTTKSSGIDREAAAVKAPPAETAPAQAAPAKMPSAKPKPAAKEEVPAEAEAADLVPCPNCNNEIEVGIKTCPHCNTEIEWE